MVLNRPIMIIVGCVALMTLGKDRPGYTVDFPLNN